MLHPQDLSPAENRTQRGAQFVRHESEHIVLRTAHPLRRVACVALDPRCLLGGVPRDQQLALVLAAMRRIEDRIELQLRSVLLIDLLHRVHKDRKRLHSIARDLQRYFPEMPVHAQHGRQMRVVVDATG
jgi:hypothetical protein